MVAWSLNLRVESIHIREIGAGNSATKTYPPDHLPLQDQLTTLAAGLEAEWAFNWHLHEHAGDRDRLMAIALIREHHEGLHRTKSNRISQPVTLAPVSCCWRTGTGSSG